MGVPRSALLLTPILATLLLTPLALKVPNPYGNQLVRELHEASHTVLFFVVQLALLLYLRIKRPQWRLLHLMLGTTLLSLTLGGIIELVQPFFHRSRSWGDMERNLLGILGACATFYALKSRAGRRRSIAAMVLTLCVLLSAFHPLLQAAHKQALRDRDFPLLMNFDSPATRSYVGRTARAKVHFEAAPDQWQGNSSTVARVTMPGSVRWSGMVLYDPWHDWSHYQALRFEVFSPHKETVKIAVNIYSAENGPKILRYKSFEVLPGINNFRMELTTGAPLAQHHITSVSWYSITEGRDLELYFDNMHLL